MLSKILTCQRVIAKRLLGAKRLVYVRFAPMIGAKSKLFFLITILQNITMDQKPLKWIGIIIIFDEKMFYVKYHEK